MFSVEIYTPGEIVAARRALRSLNLDDAKIEVQAWLSVEGLVEGGTFFRLMDDDGGILVDKPILGASNS